VTVLSAREAALRILAQLPVQPPLRVPLDTALGSVLAEPLVSPIDLPAHPNSAMDGYAVRGDDVRGASSDHPVRLRVVEQIRAGQFPTRSIAPGEAARILTGAPLPNGADCVIRQEDTDLGTEQVDVISDRDVGSNTRRAGEDVQAGSRIFDAGTPLGPAHLGVLASLAVAYPVVHRRPRVAILASGDEIVDIDQPDEILSGRRIASSNTHALTALVTEAGGEPVNLGIAADTPESLRAHLTRARDCDLLVTTAGISVGEHDHLRTVLQEMGGRIDFWRIAIRPGAPFGFGSLGALPWLGLPGNPVSTMVTFILFAEPAIRTMMGHQLPFRAGLKVRTAEPIRTGPSLQHFLRVTLAETPAGFEARLTGAQGSGILTSMARADALLVVPKGTTQVDAGTELTAIPLDHARYAAEPAF
jgi:molybdopterin molybdotransferase